jgi:hypothetical protein
MILALCGCSKPTHPPTEISERLATADRVVVLTNHFHAFGSIVAGEDVSRLAKAVASAKHYSLPAEAMFDWDVAFYKGTNALAIIHLQGRGFWLEDTEYVDETEVLNAFSQKLVNEERGR